MRPLRIVLGDLSYFNHYTEGGLYAPINIGYLATHAKKLFGADVEIVLYKNPHELLDHVRARRPDMVGLSFYYWNTALNHLVTKHVRAALGDHVFIAWGGPSVDSDQGELAGLFRRFPEVDAFVPNEGEAGFVKIVDALLSRSTMRLDAPLDGVALLSDGEVTQGLPVGLSLDLGQLDSPYLSGILDPYLGGQFLPIIQTSRLCPYTCAFCVAGKNRGKLRAFPLDQVREELDYICQRYRDRPEFTLYISDDNFGIMQRDVEVAQYILECSEKYGYPRKVYFYNDKRFTETSREVHRILGHMCLFGLTMSLQSENPDTLQAIHRRNLTPDQRDAGIKFASELDIPVTTELIFGLPNETRASFTAALNTCAMAGFDSIQCYNLIIFDGIELNRPAASERHGLQTKYRHVSASSQYIGDDFCAESERVVVANKSFEFDDFLVIRGLNLFFYGIFYFKLYHWFFKYLCGAGIPLADFLSRIMRPGPTPSGIPQDYPQFLAAFESAVRGELSDSHEDVVAFMKQVCDASGDEIAEPVKITPHFCMRLMRRDAGWLPAVLLWLLDEFVDDPAVRRNAQFLIELCKRERIDLVDRTPPDPLVTEFDVIAWRRDKFRSPLEAYPCERRHIGFAASDHFRERCAVYAKNGANAHDGQGIDPEAERYLLDALGQFKLSPADFLYTLSYEDVSSDVLSSSRPTGKTRSAICGPHELSLGARAALTVRSAR